MKIATIALIAALCVVFGGSPANSAVLKTPVEYFNVAKNSLITLLRDHVVSRSVIVTHFENSMGQIKERYTQAKKNGEMEGMSDDEAQNYYYKIVIEEMRKLRTSFEAKSKNGVVDETKIEPEQKEILKELDQEKQIDDEEEGLLSNELDKIQTEEAEMGWSMTPEAKAAMKARTKQVMNDLMSNELRQLAMAVLSSYFTGGPITGVITSALAASVKFKLVEYLLNTVMDVLSSIMGRQIRITPMGQPTVEPLPA